MIATHTPNPVSHCFSASVPSLVQALLVINLNPIQITTTKATTTIAIQRYLLISDT